MENKIKLTLIIYILFSIVFSEYQFENAFPNLTFIDPVGIHHAGDGSNRIFVVEQQGRIKVFNNDSNVNSSSTFLDIRSIVDQDGGYTEEGLLGLAFHPNYEENGYFYVNYTDYGPKRNVIARYSVDPDNPNEADYFSSEVILEVTQPYNNHNGGQMEFGSDGYLYISFGDGGSGGDPLGNGQDLSTLLSTIIRIDVDNVSNGLNYSIPEDNPFIDTNNAKPEIYAYGLRNVWRFSFDPETVIYGLLMLVKMHGKKLILFILALIMVGTKWKHLIAIHQDQIATQIILNYQYGNMNFMLMVFAQLQVVMYIEATQFGA